MKSPWNISERYSFEIKGAPARHRERPAARKWRPRRRHDAPGTPACFVGSCAGFYAAQYLRKFKLASEGTRVRITAEKLKDPARVDNFRIEIEVPVALSEKHRAGVENSVHHCLIHNTLLKAPSIVVEVAHSMPVVDAAEVSPIPRP